MEIGEGGSTGGRSLEPLGREGTKTDSHTHHTRQERIRLAEASHPPHTLDPMRLTVVGIGGSIAFV